MLVALGLPSDWVSERGATLHPPPFLFFYVYIVIFFIFIFKSHPLVKLTSKLETF